MRILAITLPILFVSIPCIAVEEDYFDQQVAPILVQHCIECHNPNDLKGKLNLQSKDGFLMGGELGSAFNVDSPQNSLLLTRVTADEMPPEHPLSAKEKQVLTRWVKNGAQWGTTPINIFKYSSPKRAGFDWWALQPLAKPTLPTTSAYTPQNSIDLFVHKRLLDSKLKPAIPADRNTLIRRIYLDLLGIPPTAEQVNSFIADNSPDAYNQLVDEVLGNPQYGERWARHWLDVVRFGESQGFERDKLRPHSWRYRDWVIDAFNQDLPYDTFAQLQLAGDLIEGATSQGRIATGFLGAGTWDEVGFSQRSPVFKRVVRQDQLEDLTAAVAQSFLGLTVNCARCHDHKFDPITQKEYYQFTASLASVYHGQMSFADQMSELERETNLRNKEAYLYRQRLIQQQIQQARETAEAKLKAAGQEITDESIRAALPEFVTTHLEFESKQLLDIANRYGNFSVYAIAPKKPDETFVLIRGNPEQRGEAALPGGIASVSAKSADFQLEAAAPDTERRLAFANWITQDNPLFARTMVNRIWHYHFGVGIVDTPNDLGFNGGTPTHPNLLEFLATEFVENDFSIKHIQRLIVTSATYQQNSKSNAENILIDADNRLLWRYSPKRMEAEVLRDTVLAISGQLNAEMHGPGYYDFTTFVANSQFYDVFDPIGESFNRRTIYRTLIRSGRNRFLDVFDCPDPSAKAPNRAVTTTPLQSLSLMNHSFSMRAATRYAAKLDALQPNSPTRQLEVLFQEAFSRQITEDELELALEVYEDAGLLGVCRAILNANELIYIR